VREVIEFQRVGQKMAQQSGVGQAAMKLGSDNQTLDSSFISVGSVNAVIGWRGGQTAIAGRRSIFGRVGGMSQSALGADIGQSDQVIQTVGTDIQRFVPRFFA
jgi:hypothetical protein